MKLDQKKIILLIIAACVIALMTGIGVTRAEGGGHVPKYICHAKGNGDFVLIHPDNSSSHLDRNGGLKHGDVYAVEGVCPGPTEEETTTTTTEPEETTTTRPPCTDCVINTVAVPGGTTTTTLPNESVAVGIPPAPNVTTTTAVYEPLDCIALDPTTGKYILAPVGSWHPTGDGEVQNGTVGINGSPCTLNVKPVDPTNTTPPVDHTNLPSTGSANGPILGIASILTLLGLGLVSLRKFRWS